MSAGEDAISDSATSPGSTRPFAQLLRPLSEEPLLAIVEEAPLPRPGHQTSRDASTDADSAAWWGFHQPCRHAQVIALSGPAITTQLAARPWIGLIQVKAGAICLQLDNHRYPCAAGGCLLVPERTIHWQSTAFSVVCVMAAAPYLADLLRPMLQRSSGQGNQPWPPQVPTLLHPQPGSDEAALIAALERNLQTMAELADGRSALIETLGLDEQLCRILTLLAVPAARRVPMEQRRLANGSDDTATEMEAEQLFDRDAFEALIAYINANLDQPLNLTLLQNHIHYSRRALQYAFRQRLGCTATQWIRGQRLDKAHRLLGHAAPGESVASIAQACGYRSMSLFSIEFQQRFHIKPSVLLREARSSSGHADLERTEPSQADQVSGL